MILHKDEKCDLYFMNMSFSISFTKVNPGKAPIYLRRHLFVPRDSICISFHSYLFSAETFCIQLFAL